MTAETEDRPVLIQTRVSEAMYRNILANAQHRGMTIAGWVRNLIYDVFDPGPPEGSQGRSSTPLADALEMMFANEEAWIEGTVRGFRFRIAELKDDLLLADVLINDLVAEVSRLHGVVDAIAENHPELCE